jgi:oligopeptidase B
MIYGEINDGFYVSIYKSKSGEYLIIDSSSIETSEQRCIPLNMLSNNNTIVNSDTVTSQMFLIQERKHGIRYNCEHYYHTIDNNNSKQHIHYFYIVTNAFDAHNGTLMRVHIPYMNSDSSNNNEKNHNALNSNYWENVIKYDANIEISDIVPFIDALVVVGRGNSLKKIWIYSTKNNNYLELSNTNLATWNELQFTDNIYAVNLNNNYEFNSHEIRLKYSSFVTPSQIIMVDLNNNNIRILKEVEVPGYDRTRYASCRFYVPSLHDKSGTIRIPISLVFNKKILDSNNLSIINSVTDQNDKSELIINALKNVPVLLYGYGSYGASIEPNFDFTMLPLLDAGIVFAVAHIRGGGEMGHYTWYESQGKYYNKMNTFYDFCDSARYMIDKGITEPAKLAIIGRSAGTSINCYSCNE